MKQDSEVECLCCGEWYDPAEDGYWDDNYCSETCDKVYGKLELDEE